MRKPYRHFKATVNSVLLIFLLIIGGSSTVSAQCNASVTITSMQNPSCFESGANIKAQALNAGANPVYFWYLNNTLIQSGVGDSIFGYDFNVDTTMVYCSITTSTPCPVNTVSSNTVTQVSLPYLTPSAVFHNTRNGICVGDTAVFSVTEINLGINPKLTWTFNGNVIDSTDTIVRVPITSYYDYIYVQINDNYACNLYGNVAAVSEGQSYFNVATYVTPSVSIINYPTTSPACPGTSYTFDAIVTDLNNPNNYFNYNLKWLINGVVVQGETSFSFQTSSLNNGDVVTAVVTSLAACNTVDTAVSNAFVAQIYAYGNPIVTFNHPAADTICHGTNVPLSVQVRDTVTNHAPETYYYEWVVNGTNPQAYDSAYDPTSTFYFQSSGTNLVYVIVRASGCYPGGGGAYLTSDVDTIVSETVFNITGAYIYGINTVCAGSTGSFYAEANTGPNPIYEWYLDGRVVQYGPSSTFSCDTLKNNDVVTATIISTQKCNVIDSLQLNTLSVTVLPIVNPTISLSTPNHICGSGAANSTGYGEVLANVNNGGPDPAYYWYVNGNYRGNSIQPAYYFGNLNTGDIVTSQFYSACSTPYPVISAPDTISVLPWVYPSVTLAPAGNPAPNSICDNDPLIVVAHPVNGGAAPQYTWYPYGSAPVTTSSDTFYYTGNPYGYIYCYMNSDAVCPVQPSVGSGDLDAVNYYSQPSGPIYSLYANIANVGQVYYSASVCQGSYVQLLSSYSATGSNAVKALFADSCGGIPIFTTTSNSLSYQINTDSPGTHIYYVRTQSPCDTSACVSFTLTVNPAPATPVINVNNITCSNVIVTTSGYAGASYQWGLIPDNNPGYNQSITNQDSAFIATLSGSYSVTVTNDYGCSSSSSPVELSVHNFVTIDSTNFTANGTVNVSTNPSSPSPNIDMDGYNFDTEASIWYNDSISLNRDFSISFYSSGYDYSNGISFVLQDSSVNALDVSENYNDDGYYGDSVFAHSLAVTLDYSGAVNNAPAVAIAENSGTVLAGPAAFPNSWQVGDGYPLLYNITWEHNSRTLTAYLNGAPVVSYTGDVVDSIFGGNPFVHFGLSAPGFQDYIDHYVQINYLSTQPYLTHSGATTFCASDSVILTCTKGPQYLWSTGDTTQSITVKATGLYSATVTDWGGCSESTDTVAVTVNPLPNVVGHVSADSICQGTAQVLTGSGAVTYQWDNGVADGDTFIQTIHRPRGDSRVFYYTVTGTDANGCSNNNTDSVTIFFTPDVFANTSADTVCPGSAVTLYGTSDWSDITYAWSNGITDNVAFVPTTTSNYMVTATTSFGCWDTASVRVAVRPAPVVTANATLTTLCAGTADTLTGGGAVSYVWDNGITDSVPFIPLTTNTYTVTGTDGNGCTATASVSLSINNVPVVGFTGNSTGCGLVSLTATGGTSYSWSGGNSPATAANTFATGGTYYVTAYNSSGCSASGSINVTVYANPVVAFNGSATGCGSVALTATGGTSYLWSGGSTPTTAANTFANSGNYTVTVSSNGCSSTASIAVTVNTIPIAGITGTTIGCSSVTLTATGGTSYIWSGGSTPTKAANTFAAGGSYTVTVSNNGCSSTSTASVTVNQNTSAGILGSQTGCGSVSLTATGGTTYLWSGGSSLHTPANIFISSGTYTVTVTNASGCSATVSALVTVNLNPVAGISGTATACGSVSLTASGGTSYLWSGGSSINTATNTFTSSGNYTVTVNNANGCHATASKAVTVNPNPLAGIAGNAAGCVSVSLTATGGTSYKWSGGSSIYTAANTFTSSGTYTVSVTGADGCSATTSQVVTINPKPVAGITGSTTGCFSVSLVATGGSAYVWSGGASLHTATNTFTNSGNYSVTVTNAGGCSSTASAAVTVNTLPGTPVFNGDAGDNLTVGVCGGGNYEYQINQIGNATSYTWTAPAGCIIKDGRGHSGNPLTFNGLNVSGEYEVSISFPSGFVSGTVSVFGTNACGQGPTTSLAVQSMPNAPGAITGPTNGVCHATNQVYSIASVPGATSYTWTVPTGVSITSNLGTSIHVSYGNGFTGTGNISVKASNGCGSSTATLLPVSASPLQPGVISGNSNVCKLATSAVYSVSPIAGATAYNWTITGGATFTGSTSGNSVTVNFAHAAGTVSLSVKAINTCASSQSSTLSITVLNNCSGKMDESAAPDHDTTVISSLQLKVYPNPTSGHLYVDFAGLENQKFTFFITDLLGNQIITENYTALAGENRIEFDLDHLAKGVYIIKAMDEGTEQKALKIVVQ